MAHLIRMSNGIDLARMAGIIGAAGRIGFRLGKGGFTFGGIQPAKDIPVKRRAVYFSNNNNEDCIIQIDASHSKLSDIQDVLQAAFPERDIEICPEEAHLGFLI